MYTKKQRTSAWFICAAFIVVTFFCSFFIVKEANHHCTGEHCPVCSSIQQAEQMLKNIGTGTMEAAGWMPILFEGAAVLFCVLLFVPSTSLVTQKVRLNN